MRFIKKHYLILLFLSFYFCLIAFKIIWHPTPFYDWDESLYIQTGKEMIQNKYFLFPIWQGAIWLDKPPLIPIIYASISSVFYFIPAEISTRMFTLLISIALFIFVYILYNKLFKDQVLSTLSVIVTAFTPIFLQRAQVVNLDLFLLFGWIGYVLFFDKKYLSFIFLFISVFSKSLIGFYPVIAIAFYYLYLFLLKKVNKKELKKAFVKLSLHTSLLLVWFVSMFVIFGNSFWNQHIIESHFRRVTSSIEFHFGQKTFYLDLIYQQYSFLLIFILIGLVSLFIWFKRNKFESGKLFYALYLLPWFLFLNLTKTKIFWYIYAAIPQFGFFAASTGLLFKKNKKFYWIFIMLLTLGVFYKAFFIDNLLTTYYSKQEPHYFLSLYAKSKCEDLNILLNKQNRKSFDELDSLGLLITTTKWWGSHPSMVYYFEKKINFLYSEGELKKSLSQSKKDSCFVVEKDEDKLVNKTKLTLLKKFDYLLLYK